MAQGINLVFFIPTCITAIIMHIKHKNINFKIASIISISGIIGAIIGARLAINMDVEKLKKYFGIFLILIAIHEIYTFTKEKT